LSVTYREPPAREPAFNAPWPALVLVALIAGSYVVQRFSGAEDQLVATYGFVAADLDSWRLTTLVTHLFLHGGWAHVGMNAVMALAFAPPVSRLMGEDTFGALALVVFYLVCGACGGLAFAAMYPHDQSHQLIGASGAVSGLMGAAARLLYRPGTLAPLRDPQVLKFTAVWVVLNVVLGFIGFAPGMGQVTIAWQAHLGGFFAGLLLIGPVARLLSLIRRDAQPRMEA
jgi:membrane associated rhomboid family serine protease